MNPFKNSAIDAVYVIHARKFTDRAAHMKKELGRLEVPFEFIEPYDADMLDAEVQKRFLASATSLSPGQNSCTLKHIETWRRMVDRNQRLALVLEDDVVFAENFLAELGEIVREAKELTPPFTIQIGCANNMYVPRSALVAGQRLYQAHEVRATDAYLINVEAARARLAWLDQNKIHLPPDHLCTVIDEQNKTKIYWSDPTLVEQGSMNGLFASALDGGRKAKPLWYLKIRFWWSRLRKKYIYRFFR